MTSVLIVLTNAAAGHEAEFNDWYDNHHLDEVLALPGFVSARRFTLSDDQLPEDQMAPSRHRYLAIYDLDITPAQALGTLLEETQTGRMVLPEYIDQETIGTWAFDEINVRTAVGS